MAGKPPEQPPVIARGPPFLCMHEYTHPHTHIYTLDRKGQSNIQLKLSMHSEEIFIYSQQFIFRLRSVS